MNNQLGVLLMGAAGDHCCGGAWFDHTKPRKAIPMAKDASTSTNWGHESQEAGHAYAGPFAGAANPRPAIPGSSSTEPALPKGKGAMSRQQQQRPPETRPFHYCKQRGHLLSTCEKHRDDHGDDQLQTDRQQTVQGCIR